LHKYETLAICIALHICIPEELEYDNDNVVRNHTRPPFIEYKRVFWPVFEHWLYDQILKKLNANKMFQESSYLLFLKL